MKNLIKQILREEFDDLQWIHDVSSQPLPFNDRRKVKLSEIIDSELKHDPDEEFLNYLEQEDYIEITDEGLYGYNWFSEPMIYDYEVMDFLENINNPDWQMFELFERNYDLEYQSLDNWMIFKRKKDNKFFALMYSYYYHNGIEDQLEFLFEVYPKKVTVETWV